MAVAHRTSEHPIGVVALTLVALLASCADRPDPVGRPALPATVPSASVATPPLARSASAEPPPTDAPKRRSFAVDAARARKEAEAVLRRFVLATYPDAIVDGPSAEPTCAEDECRWRVVIGLRIDGQMSELGAVLVDANDGTVLYRPNDGREREWSLDAYAAFQEDGESAVGAVGKLPDVKRYCSDLARSGVKCVLWLDDVPAEPCTAAPSFPFACDLGVYVGENQGTHTSRYATFFVKRGTSTVTAASHFACGEPVALDKFRRLVASMRAKPNAEPDCPTQSH